jgi:hypothetical protein
MMPVSARPEGDMPRSRYTAYDSGSTVTVRSYCSERCSPYGSDVGSLPFLWNFLQFTAFLDPAGLGGSQQGAYRVNDGGTALFAKNPKNSLPPGNLFLFPP